MPELPPSSDIELKRKTLDLLRQKKLLQADRAIEDFKPSIVQASFLLSKKKIRFLSGANRSGKSEVGAVDIEVRSTGVIPDAIREDFDKSLIRIGEYWVSSLDFPSSRDITQKKIAKFLPKRMDGGFTKEFKIHRLLNGSEIGFKSADSGREKYQGTSKLGVWQDEEHPEDVYLESFMRTTDCSGYLTITFSPIKGLTWAYQKLYKRAGRYIHSTNIHGIPEEVGIVHTPEEIKLLKERKLVVSTNNQDGSDPDIDVFIMSIYDNQHLPDAEIQRAERMYANDPAQYNARILGKFTKLTGKNVFPIEPLLKLQSRAMHFGTRGEVVDGQFRSDVRGRLTLFRDKKDIGQGYYVIGGDIAEGLEHGDYTSFQVLDHRTLEQVAKWRGHCAPEEAARIMVELGKFFNYAYIAPERNFHGFGVVARIKDHFKYPRLFSDYDDKTLINKGGSLGLKKYGWETNSHSKAIMIQDLSAYLRDGHIKINDTATIEELITYVYDNNGKTGALGGCYDDDVMALAIALQVALSRGVPRSRNEDFEYVPKISLITGY